LLGKGSVGEGGRGEAEAHRLEGLAASENGHGGTIVLR
jgi:hypothetical protein